MTVIAASSAADVGYAKNQNFNTHNLQKNVNSQSNYVKIFKETNKTQIKHDKSIRFLKNQNAAEKKTTQNKNTVTEIIKTQATDSKKVISTSKASKSLTTKKVVKHSSGNSAKKPINTKTYLKSNSVKNSVDTQVKNPTTSVKNVSAKNSTTTKKQKKFTVKKGDNNSGYQYAAAGSKKKIRSTKVRVTSVKRLAALLKKGTKSKYARAKRIFNWVRDHIRYKFYYNTRYGASGTLRYRVGNCADHAHLIVALSRDAGLKARYVHAKAHFRSGHWYGHVWAQILVNGRWYTADATSSRNSFGVARNWNRAVIKGIYYRLPF